MSTLPRALTRQARGAPRWLILALLALQGLLHWQAAQSQTAPDAQPFASTDGLYLQWIDPAIRPDQDFFRFANGGWLKANPIPPDRADWGVDTLLEQANNEFIRQLIEGFT